MPDSKRPHAPKQPVASLPEDAPFSREQRAWLKGYLAGMSAAHRAGVTSRADTDQRGEPVHIYYGSQTGNAQSVAEQAARLVRENGGSAHVSTLDAVEMTELSAVRRCLVMVSTYGEGDMPDNAERFWTALSADTAPRLDRLRYGVIGLGDLSYDFFCEAGKRIDARLHELGATRLVDRIDCDVDYEEDVSTWLAKAVPEAGVGLASSGSGTVVPSTPPSRTWTRKSPYRARLLLNERLSGPGSGKDIRHIALDIAESGIDYSAGDALGVIPRNHPELVAAVMERIGAHANHPVDGHGRALGEVLHRDVEIMTPSAALLEHVAVHTRNHSLRDALAVDAAGRADFLWGMDTLDVLDLDAGLAFSPDEFVALLRPLQYRAYSISSSPLAFANEVHLTVAAVRWTAGGRAHRGVASTWLADALAAGGEIDVFPMPNTRFRLPEDHSTPIIMIGPGTGIAPFRAFLQARSATRATGPSWLFFGDRQREHDFIYESELEAWRKDGTLTRLDLAFSRDGADKIYVQDRMRQHGADIAAWLNDGAVVYVCGDASRMARDVESALGEILSEHLAASPEIALDELKQQGRYLRDVY
ncbi:MAG: flavodoxin domain-containing protein [Pseudomonadota bacterium]